MPHEVLDPTLLTFTRQEQPADADGSFGAYFFRWRKEQETRAATSFGLPWQAIQHSLCRIHRISLGIFVSGLRPVPAPRREDREGVGGGVAMQTTTGLPETLEELQQKVAYAEQVKQIINRIHSAKDLDHILVDLKDDILSLFDAERLTLYAVDAERKEIYSKFLDINEVKEIRVPISEQSIAGFVAKYRRPLNIGDAYNRVELNAISPALVFDSSWDKKSGFHTKQILTYPILAESKYLVGVMQLVNKKSGGRFTKKDEESVIEIVKTLGIAFFNQLKLARKTPTKFDYLVANNRITQAELDAAIGEARKGQTDVESILLDKYKVPKSDIGKSLGQFYKCPFIEYDGRTMIDPELLKTLNMDYLKKNYWLPLRRDKDGVQILIDDPNSLDRVQDIKRIFPGRNIQFAVGLRRDILQFLYAASGEVDLSARGSLAEIMGELVSEAEVEKQEEASAGVVDENDSAIVRLANQIISDA